MKNYLIISAITICCFSCKKSADTATTTTTTNTTSITVPDVYKKIYGASSVTSDGTFITIKSTGAPDHKSVYYVNTNALYENFSGTTFGGVTFGKNPNSIATQNLTFKIPVNPVVASTHAATPGGPIGVAINGVPLFNQYAAMNAALTNEINGFDQWWGHPQQSGQYHYHVEPKYLTTVKVTSSSLIGFLLDGFPAYGPVENGVAVTNAMLDVYHGHSHATVEYPSGIYHYHFTTESPYLNGNGFYGTAGTVSQ